MCFLYVRGDPLNLTIFYANFSGELASCRCAANVSRDITSRGVAVFSPTFSGDLFSLNVAGVSPLDLEGIECHVTSQCSVIRDYAPLYLDAVV